MLKRLTIFKKELESGKIERDSLTQVLNSYLGMLRHCKSNKLVRKIKTDFGFASKGKSC
jgi:hypothetical protein